MEKAGASWKIDLSVIVDLKEVVVGASEVDVEAFARNVDGRVELGTFDQGLIEMLPTPVFA